MIKGYSIITDFGCKNTCKYCIWKHNKIRNNRYPLFLNSIENFIKSIPDNIPKFSISGGGDPLNNFEKNKEFWNLIYKCCIKYNKKLDIHTSYIDYDLFNHSFFKNILNKLIFHGNVQLDLNKIFLYKQSYKLIDILDFNKLYDLRIVYVLDNTINNFESITRFEKFAYNNDIQIAYRELVNLTNDNNLNISSDINEYCLNINERYNKGRYVNQNDYNLYLMPDGKVYDKFQN